MSSCWDDEELSEPAPEVEALRSIEEATAPEEIAIRTLDQALAWGDDWRRAYARLQREYDHRMWELDYYRTLLDHLDPFLPRHLQDEKKRAANEPLYALIANFVRCDK